MANITAYPFGQGGELPSGYPIVDDLFSGGADRALSAAQGKVIGNELYRDGNVVTVINPSQCSGMTLWASSQGWKISQGTYDRYGIYIPRDERWASLYVTANQLNKSYIFQLTELPDVSEVQDDDPVQGLLLRTTINAGESSVIVLNDDCEFIYVNVTPDNYTNPPYVDYTPSYLAGCTTVEGGKSRLDVLEDEVNGLIAKPPMRLCPDLAFVRMGKIWDNTQAGDSSVYWPNIIKPVHASPLGKYYMYYSLDHGSNSDANVGIKLAYSNDLIHWTKYGTVLTAKAQFSLSQKKDTETPCVIWDAANSRYLMYWHSLYAYDGSPYAQTTYISESTDGINWTYIKIALGIPMNHIYGNGHNGYFKVFDMGGIFYGYSLLGGGDDSASGVHISEDGLTWVTMQESYGVSSGDGFRFCAGGRYYIVKAYGQSASGTAPNTKNLYIQEVYPDYRTPVGGRVLLAEMDTDLGETSNIRSVGGFIDDGHIYITYNCANSDITTSKFFLAEIKVKED